MCDLRLTALLFVLLFRNCLCEDANRNNISLSTLKDNTDISFTSFYIKPLTQSVIWIFTPTKSHDSCDDQTVLLYIQHAGYPVFTITNKTFPPDFVTSRSNLYDLSGIKTGFSAMLKLMSPLPGRWFCAAALNKTDKKIRQQGLFAKCEYHLQIKLFTNMVTLYPKIITSNVSQVDTLTPNHNTLFRLFIDRYSISSAVVLERCPSPCSLYISAQSGSPPTHTIGEKGVNCSNPKCNLTILSPSIEEWLYINIVNLGKSDIDVEFVVITDDCDLSVNCSVTPRLIPYRSLTEQISIFGWTHDEISDTEPHTIDINITRGGRTVIPFTLEVPSDIGGTLLLNATIKDSTAILCQDSVIACLQYASLPVSKSECPIQLLINQTITAQKIYVPYPQAGQWVLSITSSSNNQSCTENITVSIQLSTHPCIDGQCSDHGICLYNEVYAWNVLTTCKCIGGWSGYGCTDDTHVLSLSIQLGGVLLLTLSNLAFIPCIILAYKRQFYTEGIIYFANMFFSTFYHACDTPGVYKVCIASITALSFSDFFCSILSFWVTTVLISEHGPPWQSVMQILGILFLQFGVAYARHSLWVFLVPGVIGIGIVIATWVHKCYQTRKCYPTLRKYWITFIPGCICAFVGICIFAFVETESNYMYSHSSWHVLMATAVALVLPHRLPKNTTVCEQNTPAIAEPLVNTNSCDVDNNQAVASPTSPLIDAEPQNTPLKLLTECCRFPPPTQASSHNPI